MEVILILASIFSLPVFIFVLTHLRPMTDYEIKQLGTRRRHKQIRTYFSFNSRGFNVDKGFKKRMNPNGEIYKINEAISVFPSIAAALLKYKKHEWIIIAFESQRNIDLIWLNKGFDRSGVSPYLSIESMINIANRENHTSVFILHNHPNTNPNYYDCRRPSTKDIESAKEFARVFNRNGINLIEFVCERGMHYEYFLSAADSFLPLSEFLMAINRVNGLSKFKNLFLHVNNLAAVAPNGKSKLAAALLALFLGGIGIHTFYLGSVGGGIAYLLLCWTFIPAIIGFIEGILLLVMSENDFNKKYGNA